MTGLDVYLILQLDTIISMIQILMPLNILYLITCFIIYIIFQDTLKDGFRSFFKWSMIFTVFNCFISLVCLTFLPNTKTACAIYIVPAIVNNEKLKDDASEIYELAVEKMKEILKTEDK